MAAIKIIITRTLRTYVQAACGLLIAAWATDIDLSTIRSLLIAAVPAALAALQNALEVKTPVSFGPRG